MMNRLSLALLFLGVGAPGMMFGMEEAKSDDETTQNQGEKRDAYFKEMLKRQEQLLSELQWTRGEIKLHGSLKDNVSTNEEKREIALKLEDLLREEVDLIAQLEKIKLPLLAAILNGRGSPRVITFPQATGYWWCSEIRKYMK